MPKKYVTTSGDMWDLIALKELGSEMHTDKLIKANLKHKSIYIFPAGIVLQIPDISTRPPSSLPPWKRGGGL